MFRFLSLALLSAPVFAQPPTKFEVIPSCVWSASKVHCIVQNRLPEEISCKITINMTASDGTKAANTKQLLVPPSRYNTFVVEGKDILDVKSSADCLGV